MRRNKFEEDVRRKSLGIIYLSFNVAAVIIDLHEENQI
jgi:hypothetical protein